jgi:ATP-dependent Clp protease ATP-binding subunit ClpC
MYVDGIELTERVRKVLRLAREEAVRLHHEWLGPEHLLLGLLLENEGVGAAALRRLGIHAQALRRSVEAMALPADPRPPDAPEPLLRSRSKRVVDLARNEAAAQGFEFAGTDHLLLGLLAEEQGIAARVLVAIGVDADAIRAAVIQELGGRSVARAPTGPALVHSWLEGYSVLDRTVSRVKIEIQYSDGTAKHGDLSSRVEAIHFLVNPRRRPEK